MGALDKYRTKYAPVSGAGIYETGSRLDKYRRQYNQTESVSSPSNGAGRGLDKYRQETPAQEQYVTEPASFTDDRPGTQAHIGVLPRYSQAPDEEGTQQQTDPYFKYYGMSSSEIQAELDRLTSEGAIYTTRAATDDEIAIEAARLDDEAENTLRYYRDAYQMWRSDADGYNQGVVDEYCDAARRADAERAAFYSGLQATGGWEVTEVTGNMYQDEIDWLTEYLPSADRVAQYSQEYLPYTTEPDFAQYSVYVSTANGQEHYSSASSMYKNTGFDDVVYDYINGNETAHEVLMINSIEDNTAFLGLDQSFLNEMTEDEVSLFNYIYAKESPTAAYEYIDFISSDLTARQRIRESTQWTEYAQEHPYAADLTSVMMSPVKWLSYLGQIADYAADGEIDPNAGYNKFSYIPDVIREERSEQVDEKWGDWGNVGEFGYNLLMGMGDFAMGTIASGGYSPLAMLLMGGGAAADTTLAAKDRGLSDDQAIILGTVAGAVEAVTEKFSIEALLDPDLAADGFLKYVWKNMVTEGSEEGASNLLNSFADILISGDQSQWSQNVEYYRSQGYSDERAFEYALGDQALGLGLDVLGGMLSGGFLAGGNYALTTSPGDNARQNSNTVKSEREQFMEALTYVAHTQQDKIVLTKYENAVTLRDSRQIILNKTESKMQEIEARGEIGSYEYSKLRATAIELRHKVDDAQRKLHRIEEDSTFKKMQEKAIEHLNRNGIIKLIDHQRQVRFRSRQADDSSVFHSIGGDVSARNAQSVLNGIDIRYTKKDNRFGQGFYVSADGNATVLELAHHDTEARYSIRYSINLEGQKVLDLTNPKVAKQWGYEQGKTSIEDCQDIARQALSYGYNVIKFRSYRSRGINYVIYNNFDKILIPQTVTPVEG